MYALNLNEANDQSTTRNDIDVISLHVCKWNRPMTYTWRWVAWCDFRYGTVGHQLCRRLQINTRTSSQYLPLFQALCHVLILWYLGTYSCQTYCFPLWFLFLLCINSDVMIDVIIVMGIRYANKTINAMKWRTLFRFSKWVAL